MKISPVTNKLNYPANLLGAPSYQNRNKFSYSSPINYNFEKQPYIKPVFDTVNFTGYNVHILDGGTHGQNMKHFAQAISPDMDVMMHEVEVNPKSPHEKQMSSLYQQLKEIPHKTDNKSEYIALPGLCSAPLQNIEDQYRRVMGEEIELTPQNVKTNKKKILAFLKEISAHSNAHSKYIGYMDTLGQGVEWMHEVIGEINRCVKEGYKVYVPSGHPEYQSLKFLARDQGKKPELQYFISSGVDKDDTVKSMRSHIQDQGWYDFNLLNLSDAHMVNLKDKDGEKDYLYAAYDSTVTDGARGVYNFYPVRGEGGKIKGYSYTDDHTVQYPYDEFPANREIADVSSFVGLPINDVKATKEQAKEFLDYPSDEYHSDEIMFSHVLFDVKDVFSPSQIKAQKIDLKGRYVDSSLKLFFDEDSAGCITFPACNCEGSDRPSVLSMWGSCFAVFNAIKDDIQFMEEGESKGYGDFLNFPYDCVGSPEIRNLINEGKKAESRGDYTGAEICYSKAKSIDRYRVEKGVRPNNPNSYLIPLGDVLFEQGKYKEASETYNKALNSLCRDFSEHFAQQDTEPKNLKGVKSRYNIYEKSTDDWEQYRTKLSKWKNSSALNRFFSNPPQKPNDAPIAYNWSHSGYKEFVPSIIDLFKKLGDICEKQGETYPSKVCRAAAQDIEECTLIGDKIIAKRADSIQYIGDLYPEIKPE